MAYTIYNTDGTTLLLLADNTVDQSATSLSLVGKNVNGYGQYVNNNFVKLLANSASAAGSPPRSPLTGQLWFDTTARRLKVYDGSFKPVTGASVSGSAPANPVSGDLWFDSINYQLNAYNGTVWTIVGPPFQSRVGENGWIIPPGSVRDTYDNTQQITLMKNYGKTLGVISTASFTTTYFSTSTTLLTTNTTNVVDGLTVFGSIQATGNMRVYNTLTTKLLISDNITNTATITTAELVTRNTTISSTATFTASTNSTSTTSGALIITGGVGIGQDLYVGGKIVAQELNIQYTTVTSISIKTDDVYTSYNTTQASSTITGAMVIAGGVGIGGNLHVGNTATISSIVTSALNLNNNKITNVANPTADQDAVTKNFLYSRSIALSMDISDGLDNAGIITYLAQIAPVAEYTTGTVARILCSTVTVSSSTIALSTTNGTFMITTSTTGQALTSVTAGASVPVVSVSRLVKTFTISGGAWTFTS